MKLSELSAGDLVLADDGFICLKTGAYTVQADADGKLFIPCDEGKHFLDGQVDFKDPEMLVGITKTAIVPHEPGHYSKLADEPPATFPEGYSAPLDDRTTHEMMADRDAKGSRSA
jgi:hypothetical protein